MTHRRTRLLSPGFTLLEVMMALTIFGIVAITLYGTFERTLRSKAIGEAQAELTQAGRTAVARMAEELASAFYPRDPVYQKALYGDSPLSIFRTIKHGTETSPLDDIMFTAVSSRPASSGGGDNDQRFIFYSFPVRDDGRQDDRRSSGGRGNRFAATSRGGNLRMGEVDDFFAAFDSAQPPPANGATPERLLRREVVTVMSTTPQDALDRATPTVFLENVASLGFRFHNGTEWLDAWDSDDTVNFRPLPRAVEIDLGLYDAAGDVHHFVTAADVALADTLAGPRSLQSPSPRGTPKAVPGGEP